MFQDCGWSFGSNKWKIQLWALTLSGQLYPPLFCLPPNTDISSSFILDLLSASTWRITTLNTAISGRNALPSTYWFQIKRRYFHSSISVRRFRVMQPHKHSHTPREVHSYTHTPSPFSLVINNILMAMLCSLTHSQPIHQRVQLAYDHNKYAQDECSAAGRNDPGFANRRTDVIRNSTILKKQYFLPVKNLLGSEESLTMWNHMVFNCYAVSLLLWPTG